MITRFFLGIATVSMIAAGLLHNPVLADDEPAGNELLSIGSVAPPLDIEHWVSDGKGRFPTVEKFEKDKVYVVEFWATWCGPCIASMPHLVETQEKYAEQGVQIISISDEELETVNEFLEGQVRGGDEGQTYGDLTSAYCLTADPDRSVYKAYMEAAQQNGIPTAFIVGKDGVVEWIGHPMTMDEPLAQVVAGKWDREAAKAEILRGQMRQALMQKIQRSLLTGGPDQAYELIDKAVEEYSDDAEFVANLQMIRSRIPAFAVMMKFQTGDIEAGTKLLDELAEQPDVDKQLVAQLRVQAFSQLFSAGKSEEAAAQLNRMTESDVDPMILNVVAWGVYEAAKQDDEASETAVPEVIVAAATAAAAKAAKEQPENGGILDTYAHLLHHAGKLDEALKVQMQAAENPGEHEEAVQEFLEQLKKEKAASK